MLPVQTVMIRYMVLVYRWGNGRFGSAGARDGALGGSMRGGAGRTDALAAGGCCYQTRARQDTRRPRRRRAGGASQILDKYTFI